MSSLTMKPNLDLVPDTDRQFPLTHPSTLSALTALALNVQQEFEHDHISGLLIMNIKDRLWFVPDQVKRALVFNLKNPSAFITFQLPKPREGDCLIEGTEAFKDLHKEILLLCIERNNSRRGDYQAGRKFITDYRMLFEVFTGYYLNCNLEIHHAGMKFKPEYSILKIN